MYIESFDFRIPQVKTHFNTRCRCGVVLKSFFHCRCRHLIHVVIRVSAENDRRISTYVSKTWKHKAANYVELFNFFCLFCLTTEVVTSDIRNRNIQSLKAVLCNLLIKTLCSGKTFSPNLPNQACN